MQSFEHVHAVRKSDWRGSSRKQPRGLLLPLLAQRVNVAQPVMVAQPGMVTQPVGVGPVGGSPLPV